MELFLYNELITIDTSSGILYKGTNDIDLYI